MLVKLVYLKEKREKEKRRPRNIKRGFMFSIRIIQREIIQYNNGFTYAN